MDRIDDTFSQSREEGRPAFIAYLCAGDPDYATSLESAAALLEGGADIIELGMPFSDPVADGPVNQAAAQRALDTGMTVDRTFELVRALREKSEAPIILYTYYNLIFRRGHERFARDAAQAGVDGVLVLDCPPEESKDWVAAAKIEKLANIFIVAPTTPEERLPVIVENASGFIYYVSRLGVTGERATVSEGLEQAIAAIKKYTDLPVVVGFGISRHEHVQTIGKIADGVVVGSSLVRLVDENKDDPGKIPSALRTKLDELLGK